MGGGGKRLDKASESGYRTSLPRLTPRRPPRNFISLLDHTKEMYRSTLMRWFDVAFPCSPHGIVVEVRSSIRVARQGAPRQLRAFRLMHEPSRKHTLAGNDIPSVTYEMNVISSELACHLCLLHNTILGYYVAHSAREGARSFVCNPTRSQRYNSGHDLYSDRMTATSKLEPSPDR